MTKLFGAVVLMMGVTGLAFAGHLTSAPEIDATSAVGAVALLSGALLVIRARRRK